MKPFRPEIHATDQHCPNIPFLSPSTVAAVLQGGNTSTQVRLSEMTAGAHVYRMTQYCALHEAYVVCVIVRVSRQVKSNVSFRDSLHAATPSHSSHTNLLAFAPLASSVGSGPVHPWVTGWELEWRLTS